MRVTFYSKPKQNKSKSKEAGRPIYEDVDMVEISFPGNSKFQPHFPAHEPQVTFDNMTGEEDRRSYAERFPNEFRAYKMGGEAGVEGTPLDEWAYLSGARRSELKGLGFQVVEQIAEMADRDVSVLGGFGHQVKAQAQAFIAQARDSATPQRLASENADLRAEIERLRALEDKPKRGRPRKEEVAEDEVDAA